MNTENKSLNFVEAIVEKDLAEGKNDGRVQTRFPPEPNGYLHIGHAKAICMNFGIAQKYKGSCLLRFDDTNPTKENLEYVDAIKEDIKWLGYQWEKSKFTSDYFGQLWELAIRLIKEGKAYIDEQSAEEIAQQKKSPTVAGEESPFRNRPIEENLRLFEKMNQEGIKEGEMVLRAKIDMSSPNMHFRDPIMYRIITSYPHHRTGYKWKAYPMYDFAHGQSDYFEGTTHSICTLEFNVHRPLYDWFIDQYKTDDYRPNQYEFNRLNITYTVMSKRKMLQLVEEELVSGWDDPRMPTISGLRRRGYTPSAIRNFINKIGYTKVDGMIDLSLLEFSAREEFKPQAPRVCAIMDPIKLVITNFPEGEKEILNTVNNPDNETLGSREITFGREVYIERADFLEDANRKYYRLTPNGREVRLKSAYIVQCTGCKKNDAGEILEVYCTYDPDTKSGTEGGNRKVKSTINWVETETSIPAEVHLYDRLFKVENPAAEACDFRELINPDSLIKNTKCRVERYLQGAKPSDCFQFLKMGYFTVDANSTPEKLIINRTVSLKDNWAKKK